MNMGNRPKPPTARERRRWCRQSGYGHREISNWGSGDLPAPFAEGDLLWLDEPYEDARLRGMGEPGWYVVAAGFSIDEGDGWYFRVSNDPEKCSDRMHVIYRDRADWKGDEDIDWMAPFELVETAHPEGLARREQLLADGWSYEAPPRCPTCNQRTPIPYTEER